MHHIIIIKIRTSQNPKWIRFENDVGKLQFVLCFDNLFSL